ncbi:MAG TPA: toprim domain-containing protein, partial [Terrimesophilobacter sp.]|nr:toprim domain-containing protein [Terrimesophilobacter sp.]
PVFHKSTVLYGIDLARRDIARGRQVVVVEGYTDVMACHLAGVTTAVATCGTAFGTDHITLIRRVLGDVDNTDTSATGEVIFTFDPDEAGQKAASRAFAEEQRFAAQTFVAVPPEGLDPCDLRLERGDAAVRALVESRKPMFEFMIRRRLAEHDLETVEGRVAALRAAAPVVVGIRDRALHAGYVRNLAGWLGLDPAEVTRAVSGVSKTSPSRPAASDSSRAQGSATDADTTPAADEPTMTRLPADPVTRLERDAIMAILQQPAEVGRDLLVRATGVTLGNATLSVVLDGVASSLDALDGGNWLERVRSEVPAPFTRLVTELGVAPLPEKAGRELTLYCQAIVGSLIEKHLLARKRELLGSLQRTDTTEQPERYRELQRELMKIEDERRRYRPE